MPPSCQLRDTIPPGQPIDNICFNIGNEKIYVLLIILYIITIFTIDADVILIAVETAIPLNPKSVKL